MISKTITSVAIIIAVAAMFISSSTIVNSVLAKTTTITKVSSRKIKIKTHLAVIQVHLAVINQVAGKIKIRTHLAVIQVQLAVIQVHLAVINQVAVHLNKTIKTSKNVSLMQKVQMVLPLNQKLRVALTQFIYQSLQLLLLQ